MYNDWQPLSDVIGVLMRYRCRRIIQVDDTMLVEENLPLSLCKIWEMKQITIIILLTQLIQFRKRQLTKALNDICFVLLDIKQVIHTHTKT